MICIIANFSTRKPTYRRNTKKISQRKTYQYAIWKRAIFYSRITLRPTLPRQTTRCRARFWAGAKRRKNGGGGLYAHEFFAESVVQRGSAVVDMHEAPSVVFIPLAVAVHVRSKMPAFLPRFSQNFSCYSSPFYPFCIFYYTAKYARCHDVFCGGLFFFLKIAGRDIFSRPAILNFNSENPYHLAAIQKARRICPFQAPFWLI